MHARQPAQATATSPSLTLLDLLPFFASIVARLIEIDDSLWHPGFAFTPLDRWKLVARFSPTSRAMATDLSLYCLSPQGATVDKGFHSRLGTQKSDATRLRGSKSSVLERWCGIGRGCGSVTTNLL